MEYRAYTCIHCGMVVHRQSDKAWVKSYCVTADRTVHLQQVVKVSRGTKDATRKQQTHD